MMLIRLFAALLFVLFPSALTMAQMRPEQMVTKPWVWTTPQYDKTCVTPKVGSPGTFSPTCAFNYITIDAAGETINLPPPLPPGSVVSITLDITYTGNFTPSFAGAQWQNKTSPVACSGTVTTGCLSSANGAFDRIVGQYDTVRGLVYNVALTNYGVQPPAVTVGQSVSSGATGNGVTTQSVTMTGFTSGHTALMAVRWCSAASCASTGSTDVSSVGITGGSSVCTAISGAAFFTNAGTALRLYRCTGMPSGSITFTANFATNVNFITVVATELTNNAGAEGGVSNSSGSGNPSITTGALSQSSGEAVFIWASQTSVDPTGISAPASGGTFLGFGGYGYFLTTTSGAQTMTLSGGSGAWAAVGAGLTHN